MEYARLLEGTRVEIPIVGSRLDPRLDMSQVDIRPLIQQATRAMLSQGAGQLIGDLLDRRRGEPGATGDPNAAPADPNAPGGSGQTDRPPQPGVRLPPIFGPRDRPGPGDPNALGPLDNILRDVLRDQLRRRDPNRRR